MGGLCGCDNTLLPPTPTVPTETGGTALYHTAPAYPVPTEDISKSDTILNGGGWWPGATANQEYIQPSAGGEPGVAKTLGWRTGISIRRMFLSPITGRTLVPAPTRPNPRQGHVGYSTYADNLFLGVRSQSLVAPSQDQVNASFFDPAQLSQVQG